MSRPNPHPSARTAGAGAIAFALLAGVAPLRAQMNMRSPAAMRAGPLGIPDSRMGSGTSWLPDASPMRAVHVMLGDWTLMFHGDAFAQYDRQGGPRGSDQVGVVNWAMAAASRAAAGGRLELRGMFSAEPWTVGARGYPLLLQSGESYRGTPLHDRQHPHDLFMELAALYERAVATNLGASLYLAPVGEPAVGPAAFPHRPSAADDPLAPLAHHWQDATHVTFGVLTAGVFTRNVKLEGSWFNGREPDENRTDFDYRGRRLDSYGARLSVNPGPRWSLAAWYAYLRSPEALYPDESLHRFGAAVMTAQALGRDGTWSSALIYGANRRVGTARPESSLLIETTLDVDGRNSLFARAEYVRKSAEDLAITAAPPGTEYDVGDVAAGYVRTVGRWGRLDAAVGLLGSLDFVPPSLAASYGGRTPAGVTVYVRMRPTRGAHAQ